eukprot:IDg23403t1
MALYEITPSTFFTSEGDGDRNPPHRPSSTIMAPATDPRKVFGGVVHALARHATNDAECHRRYGQFAKVKMMPGVVVNVLSPMANGRKKVSITAWYDLGGGSADSIKVEDFNNRSVNKGPPPGAVSSAPTVHMLSTD